MTRLRAGNPEPSDTLQANQVPEVGPVLVLISRKTKYERIHLVSIGLTLS